MTSEPLNEGGVSTDSQSQRQIIKDVSSLITGLTAVLALLGTFTDAVQKWITPLNAIDKPLLGFLALSLILVTLSFQRRRLTRRSQLLMPQALMLDPHDHLVGRADDISNLSQDINNSDLIWIIGESGVGKSALILAGLIPEIRRDALRTVLYISDWGSDWSEGPAESLALALRQNVVGSEAANEPTKTGIREDLLAIKAKSGRSPILIFDQFDDYQSRHRGHFITRTGNVLPSRTLVARNNFWRHIKDGLDSNVLKCVFVTRSDTQFGLQSVQFAEPTIYPLNRLEAGQVLPLLNSLTPGNEVSNPDAGWEKLKRVLASDLESNGNVLPIQLRVALRGLTQLESLTPREYERKGGLVGLEASYIDYGITEAARQARVEKPSVRLMLLRMTSGDGSKTVPVPSKALIGDISGLDASKADLILKILSTRQIVRSRFDPDTKMVVWVLDHDYLTKGILELDRRANYWASLLAEAVLSFDRAPTFIAKIRSLLPPPVLLRVLHERIRRRLKIGEARRLLFASVVRLVFNVPIVMVAILLLAWGYYQDTVTANSLVADFGSDNPDLTASETDVLWKISRSSLQVRENFFIDILAGESVAARFNAHAERVLHAAVRLDFGEARAIGERVLPICYGRRWDHTTRTAVSCADMIRAFDPGTTAALRFYVTALPASAELLNGTGGSEALIYGLRATGALLTQAEIDSQAPEITQAIRKVNDPNPLRDIGEALSTVGPRMPKEQAADAATWFSAAVCRTNDIPQKGLLGEALGSFVTKLTSSEVQPAFRCLVKAVDDVQDTFDVASLAQGISALCGKVDSSLANESEGKLIEKLLSLGRGARPSDFNDLVHVIEAIKFELGKDQAAGIMKLVLSRLEEDEFDHLDVAFDIERLSGEMPAIRKGATSESAVRIVALIQKTDDPHSVYGWVVLANELGIQLSRQQTMAVVEKLTQSISKVNTPAMQSPGLEGSIGRMIGLTLREVLSADEVTGLRADLARQALTVEEWERFSALVQEYNALNEEAGLPKVIIDSILDKMLRPSGRGSVQTLEAILARGRFLGDDAESQGALDRVIGWMRQQPEPLCEAISPFVRQASLDRIIDVLRWPSCSIDGINELLDRISVAVGSDFGRRLDQSTEHTVFGEHNDDLYESRLRAFVRWAREHHYSVGGPPLPRRSLGVMR